MLEVEKREVYFLVHRTFCGPKLIKLQITNYKLQTNSKFKIPNSKFIYFVLNFEFWSFEFVWNLEFVIWNFYSYLYFHSS